LLLLFEKKKLIIGFFYQPAARSMKESPEVAKTTIAICESTTLIEERRNEDILEESRR